MPPLSLRRRALNVFFCTLTENEVFQITHRRMVVRTIGPTSKTQTNSQLMKTLLIAFGIGLLAVSLNAEPPAKGKDEGKGKGGRPPAEVIALMKKYDKNGDRKLDETERAAITPEDKAILEKFRASQGKGKGDGK